jgi:hypothetical protein
MISWAATSSSTKRVLRQAEEAPVAGVVVADSVVGVVVDAGVAAVDAAGAVAVGTATAAIVVGTGVTVAGSRFQKSQLLDAGEHRAPRFFLAIAHCHDPWNILCFT